MTPTEIGYVELTAHAEREKLPDLTDRVSARAIIEHVRDGEGRIYKDNERENGHHYRMAMDDHEVTVAYAVEWDTEYQNKVAVVKTVFPSDWNWWDSDRFDRWHP